MSRIQIESEIRRVKLTRGKIGKRKVNGRCRSWNTRPQTDVKTLPIRSHVYTQIHANAHPFSPVVRASRSTRRNRATWGAAIFALIVDDDDDEDGTETLESLLSSPDVDTDAVAALTAGSVILAFAVTNAQSVNRGDAERGHKRGGRPPCRRGGTISLPRARMATERPGE